MHGSPVDRQDNGQRSAPRADADPLQHAAVRRRLLIALGLALSVLVLEMVGGILTNSLALLADAGHVLSDVGALSLALGAIWLATRPGRQRRTFGWLRAEIMAALLNGLALFAIAGLIVWRAVDRLGSDPDVHGIGLLAVAGIGLAANLGAASILHRHQ